MAITMPVYNGQRHATLIDWRDAQDRCEYLIGTNRLGTPFEFLIANTVASYPARRQEVAEWLAERGWSSLASELVAVSQLDVEKWCKRRIGPFSLAVNEYAAGVLNRLSRIDKHAVLAAVRERWDVDGYGVRLVDGDSFVAYRATHRGWSWRTGNTCDETYRVPVEYHDCRYRHKRVVTVDIHIGYDDGDQTVYIRRVRRHDMKVFDTVDGIRFEVPMDDIEPEFYQVLPSALRSENVTADKVSQTGVQTGEVGGRKT